MELGCILGGRPTQRYGKVKRAIASGKIIHLNRGHYAIPPYYHRRPYHTFVLASFIYTPSYISFESALSYHGWIPESVPVVSSATPLRKTTIETDLGYFSYLHIPEKGAFSGVLRVETPDHDVYFVAIPWKAIADYIYVFKKDWVSTDPLIHSLRIDPDQLVCPTEEEMQSIYTHYPLQKRIHRFFEGIKKELR